MKKTIKFFGFIALVAVIVFSLTAAKCSGNKDNGGGSDDGNGWPPNSILSNYGASGMTAPTGATGISYSEIRNVNVPDTGITDSLYIYFTATSATDTAINNWLSSNGWTKRFPQSTIVDYQWVKGTTFLVSYYGSTVENPTLFFMNFKDGLQEYK